MEMIVYLDVYFILNFVMDLVSLCLAGVITSEKARLSRCLLSAALGGGFSCLLLLWSPSPFWEAALALLFFGPMVFLAYGKKRAPRFFQITLFAFLSCLFLGGAVESLSYYFGVGGERGVTLGVFLVCLFLAFGGWSLWGKGMKRKMDTVVISLSIRYKGKEEQLWGLVDSGCLLRDPEKGRFVILLKAESATGLLSDFEMNSIRYGLGEDVVALPLKTASGEGKLFAFFPESVQFHRKKKRGDKKINDILVALDFSGGGFAGCPCLVPLGAL